MESYLVDDRFKIPKDGAVGKGAGGIEMDVVALGKGVL
jgi:hypothetical protein